VAASDLLLDVLKSEEFEVQVGHSLPTAAMRSRLMRLPQVRRALAAVAGQVISEKDLRRFVATLVRSLRPGQRFPYDIALAALAVILERQPTDFADEYLSDLARLKLIEMPVSIRVARECSKHRAQSVARNQIKEAHYDAATPLALEDFKPQPYPCRSGSLRRTLVTAQRYEEAAAC
jgi:hypothetical protein